MIFTLLLPSTTTAKPYGLFSHPKKQSEVETFGFQWWGGRMRTFGLSAFLASGIPCSGWRQECLMRWSTTMQPVMTLVLPPPLPPPEARSNSSSNKLQQWSHHKLSAGSANGVVLKNDNDHHNCASSTEAAAAAGLITKATHMSTTIECGIKMWCLKISIFGPQADWNARSMSYRRRTRPVGILFSTLSSGTAPIPDVILRRSNSRGGEERQHATTTNGFIASVASIPPVSITQFEGTTQRISSNVTG